MILINFLLGDARSCNFIMSSSLFFLCHISKTVFYDGPTPASFRIDSLLSFLQHRLQQVVDNHREFLQNVASGINSATGGSSISRAVKKIIPELFFSFQFQKLECHLLDTVLVLGRPSSRLSSLATVPSTSSLMSTSSSTSSLMSTSSAASYHQQQQLQLQLNGQQNNFGGHSPTSSQLDSFVSCGKRLQVGSQLIVLAPDLTYSSYVNAPGRSA